jgi:hypothetical protein
MLTSRRAFNKPTSVETTHAILNEDPPAVSEITRTIPPALQRVVHRCLEKAPERRFQSTSDLAFALEALSDTGRSAVRSIGAIAPRRLPVWIAGALVVLGLFVFVILARSKYSSLKKVPATSQEWEQLTDFPDAVSAPVLSPDGKMLAFLRGPGTFLTTGDVYVKMLPRGEPVQLTHQDKNKMTPAFSPDGLMLPNSASLTWIDNQHILFSEIKSGLHMAVVTATEGRARQRDVYVPLCKKAWRIIPTSRRITNGS